MFMPKEGLVSTWSMVGHKEETRRPEKYGLSSLRLSLIILTQISGGILRQIFLRMLGVNPFDGSNTLDFVADFLFALLISSTV